MVLQKPAEGYSRYMKVSDYVSAFLRDQGISKVFGVTGGASIHLLHSVNELDGIDAVCTHHEQAASMAANGYARALGSFGCAFATSGPGATNLLTGICSAWFDSIPVLHLTGQVATYRMSGELGVRQYGFQETDVVSMVKGVTKYASTLSDSSQIRHELEKAVYLMQAGRPGPALLDLPDDIQRMSVDPVSLDPFVPPKDGENGLLSEERLGVFARQCGHLLESAQRPVLILGAGATSPQARLLVREFLVHWPMPVLTTWRAKDVEVDDERLIVGTFGTHGTRGGNFTVQNADLILALGTRLSTKETGTPVSDFARGASMVIVDVDGSEIEKFARLGRPVALGAQSTVEAALGALLKLSRQTRSTGWNSWLKRTNEWRDAYWTSSQEPSPKSSVTIDPYRFIEILNDSVPVKEHLFLDTGCAVAWIMQSFRPLEGQRVHHDCNNTAMGWALPSAIGGALALGSPVTCIVGDGSLMMNLQELATVRQQGIALTLIVINNGGYAMVRQTEDQWLDGHYVGTGIGQAGLFFPEFTELARSFGIDAIQIRTEAELRAALAVSYTDRKARLLDVRISPNAGVVPQCKFGFPIEDADPPLPLEEFLRNMIVDPLDISLHRERDAYLAQPHGIQKESVTDDHI